MRRSGGAAATRSTELRLRMPIRTTAEFTSPGTGSEPSSASTRGSAEVLECASAVAGAAATMAVRALPSLIRLQDSPLTTEIRWAIHEAYSAHNSIIFCI